MVISAFAQPLYTVTDLGTLGGDSSRALAINEDGVVVGEAETKAGRLHAFLWTARAGMKDLGTLGGAISRANAINDRGIVVGEAADASSTSQPVRWIGDAGITNLPLPEGARGGAATGINHFGVIVGLTEMADGSVALRWEKGGVERVFTNAAVTATPRGINESEVIAGRLATTNEAGEPSGSAFTLADELRAYAPRGSAALAINRGGTAVGYAEFSAGTLHAARFDAAGADDLDTLNNTHSSANAVNERGEVVGLFVRGAGDADRAFLVHDGAMQDLNDLIESDDEWMLFEATGINARGQICGHGLRGGEERAFLLTPKPATKSPVLAIAITGPTNNATFAESEAILLTAEASAAVGVKRVTFHAAGESIGTVTNSPFTLKWRAPRAGDYDVFATITTQQGDTRKSARVRVRIAPRL